MIVVNDKYPSDEELWVAANDLAHEDFVSTNNILTETDSPKTTIQWDPDVLSISNPTLQTSLEWYANKVQTIPIPEEARSSLRDMNEIGECIRFLDVIDKGADFRYRLNDRLHVKDESSDNTQLFLSQMWTPLQAFYMIGYRAVVLNKKILYSIHMPLPMINLPEQERLVIPLINNGLVKRLMVTSTPIIRKTMH